MDAAVADIIASVQSQGDAALIDYTARFDRLSVTDASQLELQPGRARRRCTVCLPPPAPRWKPPPSACAATTSAN